MTVWGTGRARREFLAVDDLADAYIFVMKHYSGAKFLNVGTGQDITDCACFLLRANSASLVGVGAKICVSRRESFP